MDFLNNLNGEALQNPQSRAALRDTIQALAQAYFNRTGRGVMVAPPPPPPRPDYTPFYIAGAASIVAALIIASASRRK